MVKAGCRTLGFTSLICEMTPVSRGCQNGEGTGLVAGLCSVSRMRPKFHSWQLSAMCTGHAGGQPEARSRWGEWGPSGVGANTNADQGFKLFKDFTLKTLKTS